MHARIISLVATLCVLTTSAGAQQYPSQARGLGAQVAYQGGQVGRVNLFNGGLTIPLAIGQRYGVGPALSYGITLVYTSNIWDHELQTCTTASGTERYYLPDIDTNANAGAGWRIQLGNLIPPGGPGGRWRLLGSDGSESGLYPDLHPGHGGQNEVFFSNNGTYQRLRLSSTECQAVTGTPAACSILESAGGTVQEFHDFGTPTEPDWRLTRIRDRFGNFVDVTYNASTWRLEDSHGRTQIIRFEGASGEYERVTSVELTKFGGGARAVYDFQYRTATLERQAFLGSACHSSTTTAHLLDRVVLPDDSFYEFDYFETHNVSDVLDVDQSLLGGNFQLPGPNEPWVLNTFRESRVSEAGQTAVEEFCFDESTGALERHRSLAGTARASGDLLQVMTRDAAGFVTREDLYGGDLQGPMDNVYGDLCEMSLTALDTQYRLEHTWRHGSLESSHWIDPCDGSLVLTTVDDSIDLSTGLVSVSRDVSGIGTTLAYDALGRPTGEQPAGGAWLEVDYRMPTTTQPNLAPQVTTSACPNGVTGCTNAQLLSWRRVEYDGLGRVFEESQRIPGSGGLVLESRRSTWNAMGWPLTQSVWGDFSQVAEWSGHDRFGRPGEVRLPGEMPTRFTYHGDRAVTREVRIATGPNGEESPAFTTEVYGGQGRLVSLCENQATVWSGACQGIETRYDYHPQGALTRVCQNASGPSCGQERLFDVDGRGFLLGEKHPELGPAGNGWTTYARDALGNPTLRSIAGDSSFNLGFKYDAAGRLIKVEELAVPRLLKEFSYARSNFGTSQGKGKLYQAKRHNWVDPVTPLENVTGSLDLVVTQTYFYEGLDGAVSKRVTSVKVPEITTYAFQSEYAWHPLGLLESVSYPDCFAPQCKNKAPPRQVNYEYERGFLTEIPGWAPSLSYQAGGMPYQVTHSNGVIDTVEIDSTTRLPRPHQISTNRGWSTDTFAYDAGGNVKRIGSQRYQFDLLNRMISGEVSVGGVDRLQNANYDAYGNLLSLTTNGATTNTTTNASTNRLTAFGATYDAAGNLTRQVRNNVEYQYTFDPLGMMKYLRSTGDDARVFIYDADDERIFAYRCFPNVCSSPGWENAITLRGLGGEVLREYRQGPNGWSWERDYVYGGRGLLAAAESDGQGGEDVFHFHLDHLGTPRQITNAFGTQAALHSYYPFGQEATSSLQNDFSKKFTGHERDENGPDVTGDLDYMHARYCNPTLGRFLSFDPIGGNRRSSQSWNRYSYALNNPINYTDPEGLIAELFLDLQFVLFDEVTVEGAWYWDITEFLWLASLYFNENAPGGLPELGEAGAIPPPLRGLIGALQGRNEIEMVRFGFTPQIIDTGGVPEFAIFLPVGRINKIGRMVGGGRAVAPRASLGAESALQGARLRTHLRLQAEYGQAGHRLLAGGRIRYYGEVVPAKTPGAMVGRRRVREWNPATGTQRTWFETLDEAGTVRIVRPETGGPKVHYLFDVEGKYVGYF